ncbi:hypothetical protein Ancab_023627 [Ancistrocladus abbreviatus]
MGKSSFVLTSVFCISCIIISVADNDNLFDVCPTAAMPSIFINGFPCKNPANITASDFKNTELNQVGDTDNFLQSYTSIVTAAEYPGLNTLGLATGRTDLDVAGLVTAHAHPRASEIFFVSKGMISAGFIDTSNQVFQKVLKEGDVFIVPRGLLHFIFNNGYEFATIFSVYNSQNPGLFDITGAIINNASDDAKRITMRLASVSKLEVNNQGQAPFANSDPFQTAGPDFHLDL